MLSYWCTAFLAAATLLCGFTAAAEAEHTARVPASSNRFLVVVETSRAMQRRSAGTAQALKDLIGSGMHGQMRPGDSLAVWTFNETLFTGQFPLQEWSTNSARSVTSNLLKFLASQTYEKQGHLEKVIPSLKSVIRSSEFLMVVLVTDGSEEIHGTPYDEQVNQSFKTWATQQQDARMPFVTVLQAQRGHLTACAVAPVPWPVELPALPKPVLTAHAPAASPALPPTKTAPAPVVPSLFISGKKTGAATAAAAPGTTAITPPPLPPSAQLEKATQKKLETPVQVASTPPVLQPASVPGETLAASTPLVEKPAEPISQTNQLAGSPVAQEKAQTSAQAPTSTSEPAAAKVVVPSPTTEAPWDLARQTSAVESTRPAVDNIAVAIPAPQVALAFPQHTGSNLILIATSGALGLTVAFALLWAWKRRARPATHVSLITRSFDREQG